MTVVDLFKNKSKVPDEEAEEVIEASDLAPEDLATVVDLLLEILNARIVQSKEGIWLEWED